MTGCATPLRFDFYQQRRLSVEFSDLDLSSDAGILLARQAEERLQICQGLSKCIQARVVCCLTQQKARLFDDVYYAAASWEEP